MHRPFTGETLSIKIYALLWTFQWVRFRNRFNFYGVNRSEFDTLRLDYTNPTASDRVTLALRKTPASCSPDLFLGTIIINPGGPGASGISFLQKAGGLLSTLTRGKRFSRL